MDWSEALDLCNRVGIAASALRFAILQKDVDILLKTIWSIQIDLDVLSESVDEERLKREITE